MAPHERCARCGGVLQVGFAAVVLEGIATPLLWVAGALERERLTRGAKLAGREQLPVMALRCGQCGSIEWQAAPSQSVGSPLA